MISLIISALLLTVPYHVECTSDYIYNFGAGGWLKLHEVPATWEQAFVQCHNEGAVLASPLTYELEVAMKAVEMENDDSLSYFIGANAQFTSGEYVTIEGLVPWRLSGRSVEDLSKWYVKEQGACLSLNRYGLKTVSCSASFPFICFKENPLCGLPDAGYHFEPSTGSCYKVHPEQQPWKEANTVCIWEGGHLAIVNNEVEARIIYNMIPDERMSWAMNREFEGVYIGLRDWTGKGLWLTTHGKSIDKVFKSWDVDQPQGADAGVKNCGILNRHLKFDNINCDLKAPFVCEKDPIDYLHTRVRSESQSDYDREFFTDVRSEIKL